MSLSEARKDAKRVLNLKNRPCNVSGFFQKD